MIARVHELRAEYGRADEPFEVHVISMDAFSVDGVTPARGRSASPT